MNPKVSICVPNLNTRPFLAERFDTIFNQSFQDWELLVYDSYSDDGAWEYIQELAAREPRMRIWQGPREGTPGSWNPCLREARGEFVYIATSDDGMALDCLAKLVDALERNADCDLAHCPLVVVDEAGRPADAPRWPESTSFGDIVPELLDHPHIRRAPYDGLLHLTGRIVYLSITQLLIRRSLFARIGGFERRWGSIGDFHWDLKASLVASTVHVPNTWATFRVHQTQATAAVDFYSPDYAAKIDEMIHDAVLRCASYLPQPVVAGLTHHWLDWTRDMRAYYLGLKNRQSALRRRLFQLSQLRKARSASTVELLRRVRGEPKWPERVPHEIQRWLESLGLGPVFVRV